MSPRVGGGVRKGWAVNKPPTNLPTHTLHHDSTRRCEHAHAHTNTRGACTFTGAHAHTQAHKHTHTCACVLDLSTRRVGRKASDDNLSDEDEHEGSPAGQTVPHGTEVVGIGGGAANVLTAAQVDERVLGLAKACRLVSREYIANATKIQT